MLLKASLTVTGIILFLGWLSTPEKLPLLESMPSDMLCQIFRHVSAKDLAKLARTSKSLKSSLELFIQTELRENERLELVTDIARRLLDENKKKKTGIRSSLRYLFGLVLENFKTGDLTDWQIDQMTYIGLKNNPTCFLDDLKVHTKLKLTILEAACPMYVRSIASEYLNFKTKPDRILLVPHPELIKVATSEIVDEITHFELCDLVNYLTAYDDPFDMEDFKRVAKIVLHDDRPYHKNRLKRGDKILLNCPELKNAVLYVVTVSQIIIMAHLANDTNWRRAWNHIYISNGSKYIRALMVLFGKKNIYQDLLKRMVLAIDFDHIKGLQDHDEFIVLQFLRGAARKDIYKILLEEVNLIGSSTVGLSTRNQDAAELEIKVILDEYEFEDELRRIIVRSEFKPSIVLGLVCAMKGLSPEFIRDMFRDKEIDLPRLELVHEDEDPKLREIVTIVRLDEVNVEVLKLIVEILSNHQEEEGKPDERYILDTRVISKDELMLELVKHVYNIVKRPVKIREFSCWSFPRTAEFMLKKIELEDGHDTGIFVTPIGKRFKEWVINQKTTDQEDSDSDDAPDHDDVLEAGEENWVHPVYLNTTRPDTSHE